MCWAKGSQGQGRLQICSEAKKNSRKRRNEASVQKSRGSRLPGYRTQFALRTPRKASEKPSHGPRKCLFLACVYSPGDWIQGLRHTRQAVSLPSFYFLFWDSPTKLTQADLELTLHTRRALSMGSSGLSNLSSWDYKSDLAPQGQFSKQIASVLSHVTFCNERKGAFTCRHDPAEPRCLGDRHTRRTMA